MKKLIAAFAALAIFAPGALAASHFLKVSPSKVAAGKTVTVSGSVGHGCQVGHKGDSATVFSKAFKGSTTHNFASVPSVSVDLSKSSNGLFSFKIKITKKVKKGTYDIGGRCGGGNFGATKLKVTKHRRSPGGY